jgi:hypothetical protein
MASQVAGVCNWKGVVMPLSARLALTASLIANNTEAARKRGGSPTALEEKMAFGLLVLSRSVTFSSTGMSEQAGILYVPGPVV